MKKIVMTIIILCVALQVSGCQIQSTASSSKADALYIRLAEKNLDDLTIDDFKLLLNTPVRELARIYDIELHYPPELPELSEPATKDEMFQMESIQMEIDRFHANGHTAMLPIDGLGFRYYNEDPNALPGCLVAYSEDETVSGIKMGSSISEIMEQWGETEVQLYGTGPYGYGWALYQYIEYKNRDGLDYHFECLDYIDRFDNGWYMLDQSEWPWEDIPQQVVCAIISLEESGTFYWN